MKPDTKRAEIRAHVDEFVAAREADWVRLEGFLATPSAQMSAEEWSELARLYRALSADVMRARAQGFELRLVATLDGLAARAHAALHDSHPASLGALLRMIFIDFPRSLRAHSAYLALSALLFFGPLLLAFFGALLSADFAELFAPPQLLRAMAEGYSEGFDGRSAEQASAMTGFYVFNNVGIALRSFATGALFGLGSLFFLVYNGLIIGTVIGYVVQMGHGGNILTFICGHAALELGAIVISGGAGLLLGDALLRPGQRSRTANIKRVAPDLIRIIVGAAAMLFAAAAVEAWWSPSAAAPPIKWAAAGGMALLVVAWLSLAGRRA
ncbi:stage II sporulation protein M [Myxococcota bacterium]|nr:stage II sporulation protein M [Myxococcota bacterium]MBU1431994.1 stage II sporulation protein M [Myxococcota bacterium]MBU1897032.1 stage II sporulation protein M [Myxococcota bacterium]